jgi:mannose-1-phosphate guanylyltransferase
MLLGAGRGTRLASLGMTVPKILVDVGGEPLLAHQLRYLAREGARRVVVNAHHLAEQVEMFAAEHIGPPELVVVSEPELLGTAGAVRNALTRFASDQIIVLYGDVLTTAPLRPLLAAHRRSGRQATITVYESSETSGKGTVDVDDAGRLLGFREKQGSADAAPTGPALINAGLYVVERRFVRNLVSEGRVCDFGHDVFPEALAGGIEVGVQRLPTAVLDVGTPEKWREAQRFAPRSS